jgi:glycosyltransferase involved in cell wall biosynthesis
MSRAIIVVPCYNEALRLDVRKFKEFSRENRHRRFLFVNDGSTDGTSEVLGDLCRSDRDCFAACDLPENVGKAEAVRQGLLRAFEADPDYVGYWDADLATPLDAILTFCSVLDSRPDIDMVFGARVSLLGRSVRRGPLRHYLGRIFATAASLVLGIGFYDTQCGAKLFRASPEILSLFQRPFSTRWIFDVEIVARLIAARRGTDRPRVEEIVYEFPLHEWRDVAGSKVKPRDLARSFLGLAAIAWRYGRTATPARELRTSPAAGRLRTAGIPAPLPGAR